MLGNFNPRSLVGNDVSVQRNLYRGFNFNPRSLVGNDAALYTLVPYCADFNPRSLVGNDIVVLVLAAGILIFQSTFPRGERQGFAEIQ